MWQSDRLRFLLSLAMVFLGLTNSVILRSWSAFLMNVMLVTLSISYRHHKVHFASDREDCESWKVKFGICTSNQQCSKI